MPSFESASFSLISMLFDSTEYGHKLSDKIIYHCRETNYFGGKKQFFDLLKSRRHQRTIENRSILKTSKSFVFVNVSSVSWL